VPSRMSRAQDVLSFNDPAERFRSEATELTTTPCSHNSSFTLEQISSVVKTRVTSPVRRCGPGHPLRAKIGAMVNAAKSRRHLECRSFKTRTTDHYTQVDCSPFGILFPALAASLLSLRSKPLGGNFRP